MRPYPSSVAMAPGQSGCRRKVPPGGHAPKTGTFWLENGLTGQAILTSKALAGYMETTTGRPLVFAFFLNEVPLEAKGSVQVTEATASRPAPWLVVRGLLPFSTKAPAPAPHSQARSG